MTVESEALKLYEIIRATSLDSPEDKCGAVSSSRHEFVFEKIGSESFLFY
jgi:hypothetical protein